MKKQNRALLELHIAVFLFGFTAILGDLIKMPPLLIVWWRLLITVLTFPFIIRLRKVFSSFSSRQILTFALIGIISGLQWLTFFISIKLSTASQTIVALSCTTFFVALLEPVFFRKRIRWLEVGTGIFIIPAIILIVYDVTFVQLSGLFFGILSAFLAALFISLNKYFVVDGKEGVITYIELLSAGLFFTCILPFAVIHYDIFWPSNVDLIYLAILAVFCTVIAYFLIVKSLTQITAFISALLINFELPYGIVFSIIILKEHKELQWNFYLGVAMMFFAVLIYPILVKRSISRWTLN